MRPFFCDSLNDLGQAQMHEGDRVWGGPMERPLRAGDKNRIKGVAKQGEQAQNCKALVIKVRWRKFGGFAMKECGSYLGRSRLVPALLEQRQSQGV
jgi:hypothetical protein